MFTAKGPCDHSERCQFAHGNRAETKRVPCHNGAACHNYGCPYKHPPESEEMSKGLDGKTEEESGGAEEDEMEAMQN